MTDPQDIEAIAIIGAGARMPGARTVAEFWRNLRAGADTISRFDPGTLRASGVSEDLIANPDYVPARGVLDGGEDFDWQFFGYSAAEARTIDPQQRVFLEVCRAACDDAALDPARFLGWIGVFAGCDVTTADSGPLTFDRVLGQEKDFLATRVAYKLGLRGPAITLQTACSTSMVAVHQACQSLLGHECDAALAGGVSLWLPQTTGYLYQEEHILSSDGRCRPFEADSSGTVSSNGAGVVVLRRLSDALADGDRIMAVVRASAVNNDGGEKIGYTAPSLSGQRDVIRLAMAQAGADPADVSYVEAHGTATQIGDPVEVGALTSAFRQSTDRIGGCWIGSVKSNIGHTGAASGVAGLLKSALQLEHRELVPSLHFQHPNPKLALDSSPFEVITEVKRLSDGPVLAAVSSFGLGGTNVHAVMETAPRRRTGGRGPKIFCLSAPSRPALNRTSAALAEQVTDPISTARSLVRRPALRYRTSVVAEDIEAAKASLRSGGGAEAGTGRVAFVFPGQGALYPGAIEACYNLLPTFGKLFDEAAGIVRRRWDIDLHTLMAPGAPEKLLRDSLVQQLGLFSIGYALGRQVLAWGVRPVAMLGHSAGEYVAAALAGVWDLADGLELVAARAQAMRLGPPGGMIAVYASPAEVAELAAGYELSVATEGPGQVVLAGTREEVERLGASLDTDDSVNTTVLDADRPFHTAKMRPATGDLRAALARMRPGEATLPVVSNLTGRLIGPDRLRDPEYWADHMCGRVRLTEGMTAMLAEDCDVIVELGPGQTMTGGLRRHERWSDVYTAVPLIGRAAEPRREALLEALGTLWERGVPVNWDELFTECPVVCSLPPTQLDSRAVWTGPAAGTLDWPAPDRKRLSDRPDLTDALNDYSAGLIGRFVLDSGLAEGRLPRLATFLKDTLAEQGWLSGGNFAPDIETRVAAALARADELNEVAGLRDLLRHCVESYPDVFAGRTEPVSVLYPNGSASFLHDHLAGNKVPISDSEPCLAALTRSIPHWRPSRVLEIGAGRGGLTWPLLDAWTDRADVSYDVTDVSPMLVSELDRRAGHGVHAKVFDITTDPADQGLAVGGYDLIIGYNVVHVAPSVPSALANLRRLLRAGGRLCLVELTRTERWTHLVWGLAPGWWNAADELRDSFPHLDIAGWTAALAGAGFTVTTAEGQPGAGNPDHAVLIASASDRTPTSPSVRVKEQGDPLTRLWCAALGVDSATESDNFYRLGGESLGVVHLLGRVKEETGVRVSMAEFAASPTFGTLRALVQANSRPESPNLIRLNQDGDGVPLFLTAPGAGSTLCYRHLVPLLGDKEPVYGLESPGLHDEAEPLQRIEDMAIANLRLLREVQPHGPYRLGGWSTGAMIAHEMAARLVAGGEQVDRLLCVDGFVPRTWLGPIGSRPDYLARGLWYQLRTGNLAAVLGIAGINELGEKFVRVYQANVRAMLRYVPRPAGCPAVIFKTGLTERIRRRVHWEAGAMYQQLRVISVPGDHHSVLLPRHATALAARVREVLDE